MFVRWPWELIALQIEKNACKLRKRLPQFDHAHAANAHNTTKKAFAVCFFIWLCCEHLHICCQNDENVFLICRCFFYLHVFSEVAAHWALSATVCLTEWWQLFSVELYYSWNLCNLINEFLSIWFFCFTVKLLWNGQYCIKCCINKCNMYLFICVLYLLLLLLSVILILSIINTGASQ